MALEALAHAAAVPIFDEPGGQALVLKKVVRNAAHNGAAISARPPHSARVHRKNVDDARTRMRARVSARACEACCNRSAVHSLDEAAPSRSNP
jgi:hypothetical protein